MAKSSLFSSIDTVDESRLIIKYAAFFVMMLAAVLADAQYNILPTRLPDAVYLTYLAMMLWLLKSRAAAGLILAYFILSVALGVLGLYAAYAFGVVLPFVQNLLLSVIMLLILLRVVEATVKYHALRAQSDLIASDRIAL